MVGLDFFFFCVVVLLGVGVGWVILQANEQNEPVSFVTARSCPHAHGGSAVLQTYCIDLCSLAHAVIHPGISLWAS